MNIEKFKKRVKRKQYVVVINYYDDYGNIEDHRYIYFQDYEEATSFICWCYSLDKSIIIEENIANPKKYGNDQRDEEDYAFKMSPGHSYAYIYDNYHGIYVEEFSMCQLDSPFAYFPRGYDKNVNYNLKEEL